MKNRKLRHIGMRQKIDKSGDQNDDALSGFRIARLSARLGMAEGRNLYWFYRKADGVNFGDWIGPYLFEKMTGRKPYYVDPRSQVRGTYFSSCGSILGHIRQPDKAIVWGSGAIRPDITFTAPKKIYAVRGPLSRKICLDQGYACPPIYGDPGVLIPDYYKPSEILQTYPLGIVPHFKDLDIATRLFGGRDNVRVIDVRRGVEAVVDDIVSCECIVSSSLHGVIVAQAYGLPTAWAVISDKVIGGSFKFEDYFLGSGRSAAQSALIIDTDNPQSTESLISAARSTARLDLRPVADRLLDASPF